MPTLPIFLAARLDWGFGNPNETAALIVSLLTAVWVLPMIHQRLFWPALLICTGLGVCLMQTASRGGIVAAVLSLAILVYRLPRAWSRSRAMAVIATVWLVFGVAVLLPTFHRFVKGFGGHDLSISQRFQLWRAAPRMMVDAPGGWGLGHAADAFHEWYQPLDQSQTFLSLVNSHLTWLVEINWLGRFLYVFGWLAVLVLCWPTRTEQPRAPGLLIAATVWIGLAVTAWFSSVAQSPWLWILPAVALAAAIAWRARMRRWPDRRMWIGVSVCTCMVLAVFLALGILSGKPPGLRITGRRIVLGNAPQPAVWVATNTSVLGEVPGRTLRRYFQTAFASRVATAPTIGLVQSIDDLSLADVQRRTLVIAGNLVLPGSAHLKELARGCGKIILLNPTFFPQEVGFGPQMASKIEVVSGEFSQSVGQQWGEALKRPVHNVEGAGDYLPRWPELVLVNPATPHT